MPGMEVFNEEERREVMEVLETGALFRYGHENIRKNRWKSIEFEKEVCNFTGAKYAHAVTSGSTAVMAMLGAAGIGHGDRVIVPPFTFVAPVEAVFMAGALPVFAEIDETLCLSPESIESVITADTKAVLLVHMCGAPADLDGIQKVCEKNNLILLEDCGQAMGAFYKGRSVGLYGIAGSFSFDYFKIVTCGEGGITITNDKQVYDRMDQITDHGHTHTGNNRGMEDHHYMGFNYRINELSAAIGKAQMKKLPSIVEKNKKNKQYLKERIGSIKDITFRKLTDEEGDSATFLNFFFPTKELAQKSFDLWNKKGIGGVTSWYTNMYHFINQWGHIKNISYPAKLSIHGLGAPQDYHNIALPISQDVMSRMASIGIRANWTETELEKFADDLASSIKQII